jgi:hypothetical protein
MKKLTTEKIIPIPLAERNLQKHFNSEDSRLFYVTNGGFKGIMSAIPRESTVISEQCSKTRILGRGILYVNFM